LFKILQHVSQWSLSRPERITCAREWVYSHGGAEVHIGLAVNMLFPPGAEMGASMQARPLARASKLRLRRPAESVELETWEWEGGRTNLLEVSR
jgi:hypothetical protein